MNLEDSKNYFLPLSYLQLTKYDEQLSTDYITFAKSMGINRLKKLGISIRAASSRENSI
jgi:hypothetical protein